eukprot:TRINITY_DN1443_c0_g1_i2.p1 TRINITY_DN1443_c0_g1~~TRINITY_DN1443_c0_g1_i2.p1  ORF type:complete len:524 (-),score=112.46 TRINITY_DN1443_c0_g1_i2:255-1826(-)
MLDPLNDTDTIEDCAEFCEDGNGSVGQSERNTEVGLLDIGINLGKGQEEHIIVREGDIPQGIAEAFCRNHKLGPKQKAILIEQIERAMCRELRSASTYSNTCDDNISENVDDMNEQHERINNKIPSLKTRLNQRHRVNKCLEQRNNLKENKENLNANIVPQGTSLNNLRKQQYSMRDSKKPMNLYERGMMKKAAIEEFAKDCVERKIQEEMKEVTFKPSINPNSKVPKGKGKKPEERLIEHHELIQEKQAKMREKIMKDWEALHPFQPNINQRLVSWSSKPMKRTLSEKSLGSARFAYLFEDAKRRREAKEREAPVDAECTFKPDTKRTQEVNQSIVQSSSKTSARRNRMEHTSELDLKESLFRPATGRPPKHRSKTRSESIGDYLYNLRNAKPKEKESVSSMMSTSFVQDKSNQIVEKLRKDCFKTIFATLDSDSNGIINPKDTDFYLLPEEIRKIYSTVLEDYNEEMNLENFIELSNNIFQSLSLTEKNAFIHFHKSFAGKENKVSTIEEPLFAVSLVYNE